MTKLTKNHLLGDRAAIAVSGVINLSGGLSEHVKNDYGEDLIVQTQLGNEADNFRIYIQVKGRRRIKTLRGIKRIRFDVDHLKRWVGQIEPLIVCIFEEESKKIYAFDPKTIFSLWDLNTESLQSRFVSLSEEMVFDQRSANKIIWSARLRYFSIALAVHESSLMYRSFEGLQSHRNLLENESKMIVFNFLRSIGIIEKETLSSSYRRKVKNASENFIDRNAKDSTCHLGLKDAVCLALFGEMDEIIDTGLPVNLAEHGSRMLFTFLKHFHYSEWISLSSLFGNIESLQE